MSTNQVSKILELDKEHLHEIDGVVFDQDSYERYIAAQQAIPSPAEPPAQPAAPDTPAEAAPSAAPAPVFAVDPQHVGWYQPAEPEAVAYPIMAGAIAPGQAALQTPIFFGGGSGSGSYVSSYMTSFSTSFLTSWMTSYRFGSGSWVTSWLFGSGSASAELPGGFGLELI